MQNKNNTLLKINFITLFPKYYDPFQNLSIIKRAIDSKKIQINIINLRDYANNKNNQVDDTIYGGGKGMLLMVEPIERALKKIKGKIFLMSPQGKPFSQKQAICLSNEKELTFIAGRYEGFDERVRDLVDGEISIGDYVITGGELSSMVVADAIIRLMPGIIKNESLENDSFQEDLLDYPQYTKPRIYKGKSVPEVLLNGNHSQIQNWRKQKQIEKTQKTRPDLYKKYKERMQNEK